MNRQRSLWDSATGIDVAAGTTTPVSAIALKREVAMMRVRLNVKDSETDNENTVNFTQDASIMVYRLPDNMKIGAANAGGVSATSTDANILAIKDGTIFNTADPTSGYNPKVILKNNFTMWRDVIVWPE